MKKLLISFMALMALGGCSTSGLLTSTESQQTTYALRPVESTSETSERKASVWQIRDPILPPGLDSDRIVLFTDGGQKLDYYAEARWPAPLNEVLREFTRRSASAVLPYVVIVTEEEDVAPNYRLQVKINDFAPVYESGIDSAPVVKANVEFTLLHYPDERVVTSFTLSREEAVEGSDLDSIVTGMEAFLRDIEREAFIKMDQKIHDRAKR